MNKSKATGTTFESQVVAYLRDNGFPQAERRALAGSTDLGDVTGCPGLVIECKGGKAAENASDGQVDAWLLETDRERANAGADIGVLVMKRKAIGAGNAGRWWAVMDLGVMVDIVGPTWGYEVGSCPVRMHLANATSLLRDVGYGAPLVERAS